MIGAGWHERTGERLNDRNGIRDQTLGSRLGALPSSAPDAPLGGLVSLSDGLAPLSRAAIGFPGDAAAPHPQIGGRA